MREVVDRVDEITPEWVTAALHTDGRSRVVNEVVSEPVGTGQMGSTHRLRLTYDGLAGPPTLIAKLACDDEASRQAVALGYRAEVGFYLELASRVDVRTPRCWHGAILEDGRFTLLLDDVTGATPGVQVDGCTVDDAEAALRNLVGLHATTWRDPTLRDLRFLMRADAVAAHMGDVLAPATEVFIENYHDELAPADASTLREVAGVIANWRRGEDEPFAVTHGDYRLDNLLFSSRGVVTAIDWQSASLGPPLRDVAFFLGTGLEPADRRTHEERLVAGYHHGLVTGGVVGYDGDQCWREYRLGQLQGPMVTVIGCTYATGIRTEASDSMFLAMARRSCAAIRELRSLDLLRDRQP